MLTVTVLQRETGEGSEDINTTIIIIVIGVVLLFAGIGGYKSLQAKRKVRDEENASWNETTTAQPMGSVQFADYASPAQLDRKTAANSQHSAPPRSAQPPATNEQDDLWTPVQIDLSTGSNFDLVKTVGSSPRARDLSFHSESARSPPRGVGYRL